MAATALVVFAAVPAAASAVTTWVSPEPTTPPFNSCATPEFNSIQTAITAAAPGTEIRVCKGNYAEQVTIEKELSIVGEPGATVKLPASPANSTAPCDVPQKAGEYEEQDLVTICGAVKVGISALTLEGRWTGPATCSKKFFDVVVGGNANLTLTESKILHAGAEPINGCPQGDGVLVGRERNSQVATATLTNDQISGYQKAGIVIDNKGSTAAIKHVTVTGAGGAQIAQNGIQVSRGAAGTITESTITENECNNVARCGNGSLSQFGEDATGVLFYKEAKGSAVTKSVINANDLGVTHAAEVGAPEPQATISENTLVNDRYASIMLDEGFATVNKDTMTGGSVGILLVQYSGQEFGTMGTGTKDVIKKMTKHAVEGLSDLSPSDHFGSFLITHSKIKGNPTGASPKESVFTNNPEKLTILLKPPRKKKH